ncbi:MAG: hypothetical protein D3925_08565 [Candidatus Electrothrix sp. AR5]|nr:hypothetical protein [Candidatus Electrothrix sp. AR5]
MGLSAPDPFDAFELQRLINDLIAVRKGQPIEVPAYLYQKIKNRRDTKHTEFLVPTRVTFLDGILSFSEELRPYIDLSLFIERDNKARRTSRIEQDRKERGVPAEQSAILFDTMQTALFAKFILPQKQAADYAVVNAP